MNQTFKFFCVFLCHNSFPKLDCNSRVDPMWNLSSLHGTIAAFDVVTSLKCVVIEVKSWGQSSLTLTVDDGCEHEISYLILDLEIFYTGYQKYQINTYKTPTSIPSRRRGGGIGKKNSWAGGIACLVFIDYIGACKKFAKFKRDKNLIKSEFIKDTQWLFIVDYPCRESNRGCLNRSLACYPRTTLTLPAPALETSQLNNERECCFNLVGQKHSDDHTNQEKNRYLTV